MGLGRRVDQLLRPPGRVPFGSPQYQAHLARWGRWYGLGSAIGLLVVVLLAAFGEAEPAVTFIGPIAFLLGLQALGGWRVTHPPQDAARE